MHHYPLYPPDHARAHRQLSEQPTLHTGVVLIDCRVGAWTEIGPDTHIAESSFGDYSYCAGDNQIIYADVGKFCSIASHVRINPGNHPMQRVTQHHLTYRSAQYGLAPHDDKAFFDWRRSHRCAIGHDVWIGHGAIIMPGVSVGTGAVIGSGAVVTKDVAPYMIVGGVPAKPIRARFPEPIAAKLLKIAWWDWDRATLEDRFHELMDVERFVERYG